MSQRHLRRGLIVAGCLVVVALVLGATRLLGHVRQPLGVAPAVGQGSEAAEPASPAEGELVREASVLTSVPQEPDVFPDETVVTQTEGESASSGRPSANPVAPISAPHDPDTVLVSIAAGTTREQANALIEGCGFLAPHEVGERELESGLLELELAEGVTVEEALGQLQTEDVVAAAQPNFYYYLMAGDEGDLRERLAGANEALLEPASQGAVASPASEEAGEETSGAQEPAPSDASDLADTDERPTDEAAADPQASMEDSDAPSAQEDLPALESLAETLTSDPHATEADQWALASLKAFEAWAEARCEGSVCVAVLDQNSDVTHADLAGNVVATYDAYADAAGISGKATDHGTHVAGIVSAVTDNGLGVASVSHNAHAVLINVFNEAGGADTDTLARAYDYVMSHADELNIRVVNLSLGTSMDDPDTYADDALVAKINEAYEDYGIVTVASSGNSDKKSVPYYEFPGDLDNVVSVINLYKVGSGVAKSGTSNYNVAGQSAKNISAPGTSILSCVPSDDYAKMSGTSMAAPQVSGVLALEFAANPSLSAKEAVRILYSTATDLGDAGFDARYGWGEANAYAAVMAAKTGEYDPVPMPDDTPMPTIECATRMPVGSTAACVVENGSVVVKSGSAAELSGTTLTGVAVGAVVLSVRDADGRERFTHKVSVYDTAGYWAIRSGLDSSYVLDVSGGSLYNSANVQLYQSNGTRAQAWFLERQADGTFFIRCAKTGKALDVSGGSKASGANVQQYASNKTAAQAWTISVDAGNRLTLTNAGSGLALAAGTATAKNGSNVQQGGQTGPAALWELKAVTVDVGPVWDGVYKVSSCLNSAYVLDVSGGSKANGGNVQIYKANGTNAQKWRIEYQGSGVYKLTNMGSGRVLDVSGGKLANAANIQQYAWNGTPAQKWRVVRYADGSFTFERYGTSYVVDVKGARAANSTNVWQYSSNNTAAQRWRLAQY